MRPFARPFPLERLSLEARIIYTLFAGFMILGYVSSGWLYLDDDLDLGAERARVYYLGQPAPTAPAPAAAPADDDGPDLDLPDEAALERAPEPHAAGGMRFEKPARQVMETFHFHLFSMSVCWVIIAHIFMMGGAARGPKLALIGISGVATVVHLLTPVLIRFASPDFAFLMGPGAALMALTWTWMTVQPVYEMWRVPLPSRRGEDGSGR
ncbi:MAG: hypothetical protein KC933_36210 [Myxococcales bacterium]|nr:hypothetical protein [Myxococcales bacterium]